MREPTDERPGFSVVIPCRNAAEWVGQALASVTSQTVPAVETIVVDDGSTDGSRDAVRDSETAVQLITTNVGNGAVARNLGIEAAKGEWIAFLDADDQWYPDHLERYASLASASKDVGILNSYDWLWEGGIVRRKHPVYPISTPTTGLSGERFISWLRRGSPFTGMSACAVRRDVLLDLGGLDPEQPLRHDIELWIRVVHRGSWSFDPVASSAYRKGRPGSLSSKVVQRSYYRLRAVAKNRELFPGQAMERVVSKAAWSAASTAVIENDTGSLKRCLELALPFLGRRQRFGLMVLQVLPQRIRRALKLPRLLVVKTRVALGGRPG